MRPPASQNWGEKKNSYSEAVLFFQICEVTELAIRPKSTLPNLATGHGEAGRGGRVGWSRKL
jgi:hypothetical protein